MIQRHVACEIDAKEIAEIVDYLYCSIGDAIRCMAWPNGDLFSEGEQDFLERGDKEKRNKIFLLR